MLRVGINGRSLFRQLTGVQHYALEVTRSLCSLATSDLQFEVFCGREGRGGHQQPLPLSSCFLPASGPLKGLIWEQTWLKRMMKRAGIDVIFNPANVAPLTPSVPSVVTVHDLAFLLFPQYFSRTFALYYHKIMPLVVEQSTRIITVSSHTKADLEQHLGVPAEKIRVIPNGVNPAFRQRPAPAELERVRRRYQLPQKFFLSISSLDPRKNLKGLLHAYRLLPAEVTREYGLVLVGAGNRIFGDPDLASELAQAQRQRVHILGYVPSEELPALYRLATALVYPSLYEGFGLPVIEAMAASTPVVTSNRSSLPEVAGQAALLIDPESPAELTAAMELIAQDSGTRNLLIERGKKRAAAFSWEATAQQTLEVLREAAEAGV